MDIQCSVSTFHAAAHAACYKMTLSGETYESIDYEFRGAGHGFGDLSAADVNPLQTNGDSLRAAVDGKKGAAEIKRLAVLVLTEAKKEEGPAPADADKENWDAHVKYAQAQAEYAEYALYSASVGAPVGDCRRYDRDTGSAEPEK